LAAHELESVMLYIHPGIAIAGHVFVFIYTWLLLAGKERRKVEFIGAVAWVLVLAGLVTGMIWAQWAWGTYWSWDPKENLTLILFISVCAALGAYFEKREIWAKRLAVVSCAVAIVTMLTSVIMQGLHSFL
jgi:ABC-type transport system involved in cytochrome c biogenesis permease subunit